MFDEEPRYCIDTNVIVSFLRRTDEEHYGSDVFPAQWEYVERLLDSGAIVAPRQVETELLKWRSEIPELHDWLRRFKGIFRDVESNAQLASAKRIVNEYLVYGSTENYLGDLAVMTLAQALQIAVLTLEGPTRSNSKRRPKIPDVCAEFGIDCVSFPAFLRRERFGDVP
ncbi:MAG: DUF4411 family protein [Candidatus Dormibacteria bacterium]